MVKRFLIVAGATLVFGVFVSVVWLMPAGEAQAQEQQWGEDMLGIVREGKFYPVAIEDEVALPVRLTAIQMQQAIAPEAGELHLARYEGSAIMVQGHGGGGGWVYSAQVIDVAGPILTAVVKEVFAK